MGHLRGCLLLIPYLGYGIEADNAPVHCLVHQHVQPEKAMYFYQKDGKEIYLYRPNKTPKSHDETVTYFQKDREKSLDEEYLLAKKRKQQTIQEIEEQIEDKKEPDCLLTKISHLHRGCDVYEITSKTGLEQIDTFFERYGKNTILICRLLPFVSFDIVSYAAGLTSMSFVSFFVATGIGQLPATIVYSYVGGMLTGGAKLLVTALLILFALSAFIFMLRKIYMDRQSGK